MAGLVPAIHVFISRNRKTWMPGTGPDMTNGEISAQSLEHRELLVLQICYQHQTRRMRDGERQFCRGYHRLRGDAAGPEYRNLVFFHRHRIAIVGLVDVGNTDRMRMAKVYRRTVHGGKARCDLHRADRIRRLERPHRDYHRSGERSGRRTGDTGAVHWHPQLALDMADR